MLTLPNDTLSQAPILPACLPEDGVGRILNALAHALPAIAARLAAGKLPGDPAALVGTNDSGDAQKALDVGAHDHILAEMRGCGIKHMLSEEAEEVELIDPNGAYDIAIDPIDGSGSIGIGAPLGMLFVIYPTGPRDFARPGTEAVAAGYASFGHSLDFGYTLGAEPGRGVQIFTFDGQDFREAVRNKTIKPTGSTLAYNASNERHWPEGLKAWARDVRLGADGPRGRDFNMRWLGAAVGDMHRILLKGGAFLYPADQRPGYEQGRLRLAYEAVPMALMMEAAGGKATNGTTRILDLIPSEPHAHSALVCGAAEEVDLVTRYLQET